MSVWDELRGLYRASVIGCLKSYDSIPFSRTSIQICTDTQGVQLVYTGKVLTTVLCPLWTNLHLGPHSHFELVPIPLFLTTVSRGSGYSTGSREIE